MTDLWKLITLALVSWSAGCAAGWFACGWRYAHKLVDLMIENCALRMRLEQVEK